MRVLYVAPCEAPVVKELEPTRDAIAKQIGDGCKELCQEDLLEVACFYDLRGLQKLLPPNRKPVGMRHTIVGGIVVAKKDFTSLNDIEVARLKRQFA